MWWFVVVLIFYMMSNSDKVMAAYREMAQDWVDKAKDRIRRDEEADEEEVMAEYRAMHREWLDQAHENARRAEGSALHDQNVVRARRLFGENYDLPLIGEDVNFEFITEEIPPQNLWMSTPREVVSWYDEMVRSEDGDIVKLATISEVPHVEAADENKSKKAAPTLIELEALIPPSREGADTLPDRGYVRHLLTLKLESLLAERKATFDQVKNYSDLFNSWFNAVPAYKSTHSTKMSLENGVRMWTVSRSVSFRVRGPDLVFSHSEKASSVKRAGEIVTKKILSFLQAASAQNDSDPPKESVQGEATQESERAQNTILTRDEDLMANHAPQNDTLKPIEVASSEPTHSFEALCNRWMPVKSITVNVNDNMFTTLATYNIPESFVSKLTPLAPSTLPFQSFVYGDYDLEMQFIVNANKFHCGKVIADVKYDSYGAEASYNEDNAALSRHHVIMDLSSNNVGKLVIPFRYHRVFVRNSTIKNSVGVRPLCFATVHVKVLSQLRTGPGGPNSIEIRPFYRFTRARFAGMSYKVPVVQMESILEGAATGAMKGMIGAVERQFAQIGASENQDKPTANQAVLMIPKPRLHFPNGRGLSDATVLRNDPTALTSFRHFKATPDQPRTMLDIAQIWGLRKRFNWATTDKEGDVLTEWTVDPTTRMYESGALSDTYTPLEYACSFYQFWAGPIEVRLDFVSNSFHTGAVILSAEFNRRSDDTSEMESHCTYTKMFHLGDQKSVTFRIPYIYDTIMRRNAGPPFTPMLFDEKDISSADDGLFRNGLGLRAESSTRFKVRVINALRPVASAPQSFEVLMFIRGGKNFFLHGLCQSSMFTENKDEKMTNFPADKDRYPLAIAQVQMDTGEKENEDPTEDFSHGTSAFGLQSLDAQVNIKDILRRPALIVNRGLLRPSSTQSHGLFVPCMPPSQMWKRDATGDREVEPSPGITANPSARIMDMFRFWRGSMRYTVVVEPTTRGGGLNGVYYVTYVPHSGVRIFGNKLINSTTDFAVDANRVPLYGSGLTTEIIVPQINPTAVVEVPYDTENNWTLTFESVANENYSWRDKGDTNSGHLVISGAEEAYVTIWWAAGDDFEVSNFFGIPQTLQSTSSFAYSDAHPTVQMEDEAERVPFFSLRNVGTTVSAFSERIQNTISPDQLGRLGVYSLPIIGQGAAIRDGLDLLTNVSEGVTSALSDVTQRLDTLTEVSTEAVNRSAAVVNGGVQFLVDKIDSYLKTFGVSGNVFKVCYDILLDVAVAVKTKSWFAIAVGIVRFVSSLFSEKVSVLLMEQATKLGATFNALFSRNPTTQAPANPNATIVGIIAGIVGTVLGVKLSPGKYNNIFVSVLERLTSSSGAGYLNNVLRYVEATFTTIQSMVLGVLGYVSPQAEALKMLSGASETIGNFIEEAQMMTSEANSALMQDPGFRLRFWNTVMQAYQLQKLIATAPPGHASPVIVKLCADVIRVGNEKFIDISSAPVRYEPFVICIEGPAGIGKSEMVESLVADLLKGIELNRPHSGATYYRMPGSAFWSGYRDQPVVVYDDWLNLTDTTLVAQQLGELYQLKSTSLFIPPMAHLEEKKIRGNPLIVILLCNNAFPDCAIDSIAHTKRAIYRRRDVLLRASRKPEYEGRNLRDMSEEEQTQFKHLVFQRYPDPAQCAVGQNQVEYSTMSNWMVAKFKRWHAQEQIKVARRLELARAGMSSAPIKQIRLEDPFSLYYSVSTRVNQDPGNSQNAFLPSEVLAMEVDRIVKLVEEHQEELEKVQPPEEPEDPFVQSDVTLGEFGHYMITHLMRFFKRYGLGMTLARATWKGIVSLARYGLAAFAQWYYQDREEEHCGYCDRLLPRFMVCFKNGKRTNHFLCRNCAFNQRVPQCEECDSQDMRPVGLYEQVAETYLIGKMFRAGLMSLDQFLAWGERQLCTTFGSRIRFALSSVAIAGYSLATETHPIGRFICALSMFDGMISMDLIDKKWIMKELLREAQFRSTYGSYFEMMQSLRRRQRATKPGEVVEVTDDEEFAEEYAVGALQVETDQPSTSQPSEGSSVPLPNTQADDEWELPQDAHIDIFYGIFKVDWTEDMVEKYLTTYVAEEICHHATLLTGTAEACYYHAGRFYSVMLPSIGVSEFPCCDRCPMTNREAVLAFFTQFKKLEARSLQTLYHSYTYNKPARPEVIQRLPFLLRAKWMVDPREVFHQVERLCPKTWWQSLGSEFASWKNLLIAAGGVGATLAAYRLWTAFTADDEAKGENLPQPQHSQASGDECTRNLPKQHRELHRPNPNRSHFQADAPDIQDVVSRYVARNYVAFDVYEDKVLLKTLIAVGVAGRVALMPKHYVKAMRKYVAMGRTIMLGPAMMSHERTAYNFDECDFVCSPTTDLARFTAPPSYGMFKDIRKFFAMDADLERSITPDACILLAPTAKNPTLIRQNIEIKGFQRSEIVEDEDGERFQACDVLVYGYSRRGACGSLVLLENTQRPIISMHFAGVGTPGTEGEGFGVILTQESIGNINDLTPVTQMEDPDLEPLDTAAFLFPEDTNVTYLGALAPDETVFLPKKTKIRPSLVQGQEGLEPKTFPCILSKDDKRYVHEDTPLFAGSKKHGVCTSDFTSSQLQRVQNALWDGWLSRLRPAVVSPKRLTPEQAAVGLPGVDYYDPMVLDTSAGFPYVLGKRKRKEDYVQFERDEQARPIAATIDKPVLEKLARDTELRRSGVAVFTPFIDTLKDERRKPEKLMKYGGTRIFCNPPLEYVLATRQNLLHFTAAFMKFRMTMQHAVGINPCGTEWTQMVAKLVDKSPHNIVTIDYSNFGPGFNAGVAQKAVELMIRWTTANVEGVDRTELHALLAECVNSAHICHNLVYRQKCGSPSGAPITTIINSLVNQLLILLAWDALCARDKNTFIWEEFRDNVALFVYGDDLIMSVTDKYIDYFNGKTITSWFRKYGIVATDASKTEEVKSHVPIFEAEFLKRGFVRHPTREHLWLSPLSWTSVNDCTQWIWQCADRKEATYENCRAALISAHGHGPQRFNEFKEQVNSALRKRRIKPLLLTWEEIDSLFYDTD